MALLYIFNLKTLKPHYIFDHKKKKCSPHTQKTFAVVTKYFRQNISNKCLSISKKSPLIWCLTGKTAIILWNWMWRFSREFSFLINFKVASIGVTNFGLKSTIILSRQRKCICLSYIFCGIAHVRSISRLTTVFFLFFFLRMRCFVGDWNMVVETTFLCIPIEYAHSGFRWSG